MAMHAPIYAKINDTKRAAGLSRNRIGGSVQQRRVGRGYAEMEWPNSERTRL